ncbi:MAG: SPFH domain-containing protein [Acidobacteriota bacterium]
MLGIRYVKTTPTTYVLHYAGGKLKKEGAGLAFFAWAPTSTIVQVPLASADVPFAFQESTADFQTVTIQGQLTYRVVEPRRLAELLDFTVLADSRHASDDPEKVPERIVSLVEVLARASVSRLGLRDALRSADLVGAEVLSGMQEDGTLTALGVRVLGVSVLAIRATPEMARALEAEAREGLHRQADEAIYARRNAAVVEERRIKESEIATEIAVEQQRAVLIEQKVENDRKDADSKAYALETSLAPIRSVDWRTVATLAAHGGNPRALIALAFQELAGNAQKIGELNVSPDLLRALVK